MTHEPLTFHVPNDSELARLLQNADHRVLFLESDGLRYRFTHDDDPFAGYGAEATQAGMRNAAGSTRKA